MSIRLLGPAGSEVAGDPSVGTDRFLVDAAETGGRVSLVEHMLMPGVLAAPMHRHVREDEFSYVLQGRLGAIFDGEVVVAGPGEMVRKPRGEWHTFWNAGDEPTRLLEVITPGGLEDAFREIDGVGEGLTAEVMADICTRYEVQMDLEATERLLVEHGLRMS